MDARTGNDEERRGSGPDVINAAEKCSTEKWKGATMQSSTTLDPHEPKPVTYKPVIYKAAIFSKIFLGAVIGVTAPPRTQGFRDHCPR